MKYISIQLLQLITVHHCEDHVWCSLHDEQCGSKVGPHWVIHLPLGSLYTVKLNPMINILFPPIATETLNYIWYDHRRVRWLPTRRQRWSCQPRLLTPYPDPEPGPQQRYNITLCRTWARVEMTIGMLNAQIYTFIVACVILHNIATIRGERYTRWKSC